MNPLIPQVTGWIVWSYQKVLFGLLFSWVVGSGLLLVDFGFKCLTPFFFFSPHLTFWLFYMWKAAREFKEGRKEGRRWRYLSTQNFIWYAIKQRNKTKQTIKMLGSIHTHTYTRTHTHTHTHTHTKIISTQHTWK